jgi:hypothetical protein
MFSIKNKPGHGRQCVGLGARMGRWHVSDLGVLAGSSPQTTLGQSDQSLGDSNSVLLSTSLRARERCACFLHGA